MNDNLKFLFDDEYRLQFYLEYQVQNALPRTIENYKYEKIMFMNIFMTKKDSFLALFHRNMSIADTIIANVKNQNYLSVFMTIKAKINFGQPFSLALECLLEDIEDSTYEMISKEWSNTIHQEKDIKTKNVLHMIEQCGVSLDSKELREFRETHKIRDEDVCRILNGHPNIENIFKELIINELLLYTEHDYCHQIKSIIDNANRLITFGIKNKPSQCSDVVNMEDSKTICYGSFGTCILTSSKKVIKHVTEPSDHFERLRFVCDHHPNLMKFETHDHFISMDYESMIPLKHIFKMDVPLNFIVTWAIDILSVLMYLDSFDVYASVFDCENIFITQSLDIRISLSKLDRTTYGKNNLREFGIIFMQMLSKEAPIKMVTKTDKIMSKYKNVPIFAIKNESVIKEIYSVLNEKYMNSKTQNIDYFETVNRTTKILNHELDYDTLNLLTIILNRCASCEKTVQILDFLLILNEHLGSNFRRRRTVECVNKIIDVKQRIKEFDQFVHS